MIFPGCHPALRTSSWRWFRGWTEPFLPSRAVCSRNGPLGGNSARNPPPSHLSFLYLPVKGKSVVEPGMGSRCYNAKCLPQPWTMQRKIAPGGQRAVFDGWSPAEQQWGLLTCRAAMRSAFDRRRGKSALRATGWRQSN